MSEKDKSGSDPFFDDELFNTNDNFDLFEEDSHTHKSQVNIMSLKENDVSETSQEQIKRTSADFAPDMDALLLTAQSSMIIEGMKLISLHDYKSKNVTIFTEAVKGVDLYIKIIERNPANFRKLILMLSADTDCVDIQNITSNLYKNLYGETPESDSQKLKAFELLKEHLKTGYNKSLISSSLSNIKKYYLLTGSLDTQTLNTSIANEPDRMKAETERFIRHINIARQLIQSGNSEIIKGMKGKELNIFIIKASEMLIHYFIQTKDSKMEIYYSRLNENFKKYFIIR